MRPAAGQTDSPRSPLAAPGARASAAARPISARPEGRAGRRAYANHLAGKAPLPTTPRESRPRAGVTPWTASHSRGRRGYADIDPKGAGEREEGAWLDELSLQTAGQVAGALRGQVPLRPQLPTARDGRRRESSSQSCLPQLKRLAGLPIVHHPWHTIHVSSKPGTNLSSASLAVQSSV